MKIRNKILMSSLMLSSVISVAGATPVSADTLHDVGLSSLQQIDAQSVIDLSGYKVEKGAFIDYELPKQSSSLTQTVTIQLVQGNMYYLGTQRARHIHVYDSNHNEVYSNHQSGLFDESDGTFRVSKDDVYSIVLSDNDESPGGIEIANGRSPILKLYQVLEDEKSMSVDLKSVIKGYTSHAAYKNVGFVLPTKNVEQAVLSTQGEYFNQQKYELIDRTNYSTSRQINYRTDENAFKTDATLDDTIRDYLITPINAGTEADLVKYDAIYFNLKSQQDVASEENAQVKVSYKTYLVRGGYSAKNQIQTLTLFDRTKSFIGDPVDTYSGAFVDNRTLLSYAGNNPLHFDLNYNSVTNDSESLAGGFTHNFETKLVHNDDSVSVHWTPNTYFNFKKNADGSFTAEDEKQSSTKVSYQDNQYIVTTESDGMYVFNDKGFVVSHTDISGQETVYKYTDNQLTSVSNNRGQSFVLSYESNHLKTVKDGNGHQLTFNYNSDYTHLDSISMPDDKKYEINYSAKDQVESLRYNNHTLIDNTYDIAGRVISQRDAKGITTSYSYDEYTNSNQLKTTHETNGVKTVFVHDLNGNLLSKTDGNNHTTSSEYDALNQKTADIDANNNKTVYQYDNGHHVSSQTDSLGRQKQFEYTNNLLTKVITADGSSATYAYNNKKQLVSSKDSAGHDISYSYTARGDLSKVISGDTSVENTYDDNGYLIATTKNGVTTKFLNDSQGRQVKIIATDGTTIEKTYDLNNNVLTSSVAGKITKYTYDDFGNQLTVTSPTGHVVTNEYDDNQNLVSTTDGDNITRYSYNDSNQLTKASLNYEDIAQYTYDNAGQVLTSQKGTDNPVENSYDPNGNLIETKQGDNKSHYDYDGANQLITSTDALGRQIHLKYDVNGQVVEKTDADGQVTTYTYNQSNQVETMRQGSHEVTYGYDSAGNKISETDESNHQTTFEYNKDSQLVSATNALGYKTYYEYNQIGQLVKTYNNRHEMTMAYEYNATGQVTKLYDANGLAQTMTYDDSGKLLVVKDAEGNIVSSNVYDETDRLISTIGALNQKSEISYSSNGSSAVTTTTDSMGNQQSTTTDYAGRVTSNQDSQMTGNVKYNAKGLVESQSLGYDETNKTFYEYDTVGRVTKESNNDSAVSYTYNISDQIESWTNARGQATNYTYDSDGNVVSVKSDDIAIDYKFDQSGNMTEASDKNGAITKAYDALGRVISKTFNNQTIGYQYDDRGFMTELIYPGNKVVKYDYDTSGRVLSMTDWNGHTVKYTYDKLNRVVKTVNWNGLIEEKSYNNAGQVLTLKTSIKNNVITNYKYAYDSNGNLIKDNSVNYTYDTLSRLTAGKSSASYSYDSIGNITAANNHNFEVKNK